LKIKVWLGLHFFVLSFKMEVIAYQTPEYHEMLTLRQKILREPLGLSFSDADLQQEKDDIFITYREDGRITACCILTRLSGETVKLRQMAVDSHRQGKNIGTDLLLFAEQYVAQHGYTTIQLHARKTASKFYAKYGYAASGDEFTEVGIPHIFMEKIVSRKS